MPEEKTRAIRAALAAGGKSLRRIAADHRVGFAALESFDDHVAYNKSALSTEDLGIAPEQSRAIPTAG